MMVGIVKLLFFDVVILTCSSASWHASFHFEYLFNAPGEMVLTSPFVDRYAGASRRKMLGCASMIAIPMPWNLDFSPFASVQGMIF